MSGRRQTDDEEENDDKQTIGGMSFRVSFRDAILVIGTVITVVTNWGLVNTRMSVSEQRDLQQIREIERLEKRVEELENRQRILEIQRPNAQRDIFEFAPDDQMTNRQGRRDVRR